MVDTGRAAHNPLTGLKMLNVEDDRKYRRRAFTVDELRRLIATTEKSGKPYLETVGEERAAFEAFCAKPLPPDLYGDVLWR